MVSGGINVATDRLIREQQAKANYKGLFTRTKAGRVPTKRYLSQLNSMASQYSKAKKFAQFEAAMKKYASMTDSGDLSFKSFLQAIKVRKTPSKSVKGPVIDPALHSGISSKAFVQEYKKARTLEDYRRLYVKFLTDFVLEEHQRNVSKAQKQYDKVAGGIVPSTDVDITSINIAYDQDGNMIIKDRTISLDSFIESLKGEGTLKRRASDEYFKSDLNSNQIMRKEAKQRNWIESWYHNLMYSLTELGWSDIADMIKDKLNAGEITVNDLYDLVFKSTYYNFVFEYNNRTGEYSADHDKLVNDINNLVVK